MQITSINSFFSIKKKAHIVSKDDFNVRGNVMANEVPEGAKHRSDRDAHRPNILGVATRLQSTSENRGMH